jgi:acetate kinase
MVEALTAAAAGALGSLGEVGAVGHRVVHGGERFAGAAQVTDEVLDAIGRLSALAPLHNPVNLLGIREAQRLLPGAPHVAVFDTSFHHTLPPHAYLYGLPFEFCEQRQIRRYGFHGMSHAYVALKAAEFLGRPFNALEIVSCHLGNGASLCAIDHGRSVDTSMGFTPAEGLIMGTRCGTIDPAILVHLMRTEGMGADGLDRLINKQSGLKGLSGISNDMREIERAAQDGDRRALLALKAFSYQVRKHVGAYVAAMGGVDALIFTGGIGQGSAGVRSLACQGLEFMGIAIDEEKNREAAGFERVTDISRGDSRARILVVPTDEERMIARETLRVLESGYINNIIRKRQDTPVPIEVSAHHVHLSQQHVEALFGAGHRLTPAADLSQPGQFASREQVTLVGPKGKVERVRVLGPARRETQVEISMTEQFKLGVQPPIRESGDLRSTPGVSVEGPAGSVALDRGVICALRHVHMSPEDALSFGLRDKLVVSVRVGGDRELTFGDVLIRVHPDYRLAMHIDTDEANAANIVAGATGTIVEVAPRD